MSNHQDVIIEAAEKLKQVSAAREKLEEAIALGFANDSAKIQSLVDELSAEQIEELQVILERTAREKRTVSEFLSRAIDYLIPEPQEFDFAFESPYAKASWLLQEFGTFTPSQRSVWEWRERYKARMHLKAGVRSFLKSLLGGKT